MAMMSEQARWLRQRAAELRRMADRLEEQANALDHQEEQREVIGGRDLVEAAVMVLTFEGSGGMHYRDLIAKIERQTGKRISGADPASTLLANIGRDPRIKGHGNRSGIYELDDAVGA